MIALKNLLTRPSASPRRATAADTLGPAVELLSAGALRYDAHGANFTLPALLGRRPFATLDAARLYDAATRTVALPVLDDTDALEQLLRAAIDEGKRQRRRAARGLATAADAARGV